MSGLLRRIRRPGAAEETRTEAVALPEPAHGSAPETAPVRADGSPLPAGVTPEDLERRRGAGRRGRVRRRARFLRRARELALRDLGGLVYEAARRDQDGGKLVKEKVAHLGVIDSELRVLEAELGAPRGETVLREPGVGGTCPRCGELHASDARFCSRCGLDLTAVPAPEQAEAAAPEPADPAASEAASPADGAEAKPAEPTAGAAADGTGAVEPAAAEEPRRESKRWWRRRSPAASAAIPAEAATGEATVAEPKLGEATAGHAAEPDTSKAAAAQAAEPETREAAAAEAPEPSEPAAAKAAEPSETPAAEQPTTDLAAESPQTGNGRATKKDALDPERSA